MAEPSRRPAAMRIVSLSIRRPNEENGNAESQAPDSLEAAARRRARVELIVNDQTSTCTIIVHVHM